MTDRAKIATLGDGGWVVGLRLGERREILALDNPLPKGFGLGKSGFFAEVLLTWFDRHGGTLAADHDLAGPGLLVVALVCLEPRLQSRIRRFVGVEYVFIE